MGKARRGMVVVGDGSYIPVNFFDVPIRIGGIELTATIGFSERLGVGFNLLGRRGVFDLFIVCFNDREEKVTFQEL